MAEKFVTPMFLLTKFANCVLSNTIAVKSNKKWGGMVWKRE
jgi:hypothetical protein